MYRIRRFGVLRTAWVSAVMYFVLFAVILVPVLLLAGAAGVESTQPGADELRQLGPLGLALIGLFGSLLYAAVAFVFVALTCLLYNFVARFTGGVEVQVERREPEIAAPLPASWNRPQPNQWGGTQPPPSAG